jgi:hypothetical protein
MTECTDNTAGHSLRYFCNACRHHNQSFFISTNFAIYPAVLAGFAGLLLFLSSLLCITLLPLTLTLSF